MMKLSTPQRATLPFCIEMVHMGARPVTIHKTSKLPPEKARDLCKALGKSAPSGQTPDDASYFTQNLSLRKQGAVFLLLYHTFRSRYDIFPYDHPLRDAGHVIGITLAYSTYLHCYNFGAVPVDIARFEMLARGYNHMKEAEFGRSTPGTNPQTPVWKNIPGGAVGRHLRNAVRRGVEKVASTKIMPCRKCRLPLLVAGYKQPQWSCSACVQASRVRTKKEKRSGP